MPVKEIIGTKVASLELDHAHSFGISPEGEVFIGLHDGLAVSYDDGKTWREVKIAEGNLEDFMAITVDPKKPSLIYVGGHGHGVWRSNDYGKNWRLLNNGLPVQPDIHALALDPSNSQVIYAMLTGDGLYKTKDGGATWSRIRT